MEKTLNATRVTPQKDFNSFEKILIVYIPLLINEFLTFKIFPLMTLTILLERAIVLNLKKLPN